jgi:hypothetical protein
MKSPVEKLIVKLYEEGADVGCWVDKLPVRIAQVHRHFWVYKLTKSFETIASMLLATLLLWCAGLAAASQLRNDPENPFVAYGNGTKFDISKVFTYP